MKKNVITLGGILLVILLFSIYSCQQETINQVKTDVAPEAINAVLPPLKNIEVTFGNHLIDATKGGQIRLKNGTKITIPADAFTDIDGRMVKGKVDIQYREFHNATDIIASGIPMKNKEGTAFMETAGMFEMRGKANGKEIFIAPEKDIEVAMASEYHSKDEVFDFFNFDEETGNWKELGTAEPVINKKNTKKSNVKLPPVPTKPLKYDENKFVFDLDVNYKKFPELRAYHGVVWQYDGSNPNTDPEKNAWVFEEDWKEVDIQAVDASKGKYELTLKAFEKSFSTEVCPVLKGKEFEKALADFNNKTSEYKKVKKQAETEKARKAQEAELVRSFRISNFGIFNWDIWKDPRRMLVDATFDFGDSVNPDLNNVSVFLVTGTRRSVVRYNASDAKRFSYEPGVKNCLLAVLPGNKIGVYSAKEFEKMNAKDFSHEESRPFTFDMKMQEESISDLKDLDLIIDENI